MNRDSVVLIWTTIITVVLLIWVYANPPYRSDDSINLRPFSEVQMTQEDVKKIENLSR